MKFKSESSKRKGEKLKFHENKNMIKRRKGRLRQRKIAMKAT